MKALVTGAGGFIGGHLVKRLARDGHNVVATDLKRGENWWQIYAHRNYAEINLVDQTDVDYLIWKANPDVVFHMAAWMGGIGYISNPEAQTRILHDNTVMTLNILELAQKAGVKKFFFPSSVCVYPPGVCSANHKIVERDAGNLFALTDTYSKSKLYLEEAVRHYGTDMKVYIARFQNVYGPHGDWTGGKEKAPAALCRKVAEAKLGGTSKVEIWGDGEQARSPMYVGDCVEGVLRLIKTDYHGPVNLGPDQSITINELVDVISAHAGIDVEKVHVDGPQGSRARLFDHKLLRDVLGWVPSTFIVDGIGELYHWVEEQVENSSPDV